MNLAILHYHLNRGGVTRVIENQLRALDAVLDPRHPWTVAILYGGRHEGWNLQLAERFNAIHLSLHEVPSLDYDGVAPIDASRNQSLGDVLSDVLAQLDFAPRDTVVHVHNHAVGKNVALPAAVTSLAEQGYPLLLQIHDFAEDLRPGNFRHLADGLSHGQPASVWHGRLYPLAPHVHYAVLNGRDHNILQSAGVPAPHLHLLPNPVPSPGHLPPRPLARRKLADRFHIDPEQRFMLYPVRCIRRKNAGEALLYSLLAEPGTVIGLTLPPLNPAELPIYEHWRTTADRLNLPCHFGVAAPGALSFDENLAAADAMITTSVAEGFGMVFLESWLTGNVLVGRDLPEITADFTRAGLRLDLLQPKLLVPATWVGVDRLHRRLVEAYCHTLAAYGRPAPSDLNQQVHAKTADGLVDFSDLDEPLQTSVLEAVRTNPRRRDELLTLNPQVAASLEVADSDAAELIRANAQTIEANYALLPSGHRLKMLYQHVTDTFSGPTQSGPIPHPDRILNWFLDLKRFRLVRN